MHEQIERDRPLEKAVQAIENVIRHHGAPHLRPASCKLSMLQRESMDVMLVLLLLMITFVYLIVRIIYAAASVIFMQRKTLTVKKNQ